MKKILSIALAVLLVLSLAAPAFADDSAPVAGKTHTYTAYQIFSGTQAADDPALAEIAWGSGIDSAAFLAALQGSTAFGTPNPFAACTTAPAVASAMKNWADSSDEAMAFAKLAEDHVKGDGIAVVNGQTTLDAGYYLVVDTTATVGADDAYNVALLQLTKKDVFAITPKNSVVKVEKKLSDEGKLTCTKLVEGSEGYDKDHVHGAECYTWADANNVAIGDTVHFKIESAVPAAARAYDYYFFIINDTLSKGLTYTSNTIKVYIGGTLATGGTDYSERISGQNIQIALADAVANAGKSVVVTYDATLNESAAVGTAGNPNEVYIDYSNNPNEDFAERADDANAPGFPAQTTYNPGGKTPKDYTVTYASKLNVYKVDGAGEILQGAEFTLSGTTLNKVLVFTEKFTKVEEGGTYWKLNNGSYTTSAPVTADKMVAAEEGATEGYVVDAEYTGENKVVIGETTYRPYVAADDTGKDLFTLVKANTDKYASTTDKYKCEWVSETKTASGETLKVVGTVDANGVVSFAGLPAGTYTLSETKAPAGYNPAADITFTVSFTAPDSVATGTETCTWSAGESTAVAYAAAADAFETVIKNEKGGTLPETGGIGTTVFYVLGGVLVVAAGVLLIAKKRAGT